MHHQSDLSKIAYLAFQDWLFAKTLERRMCRFLVGDSTSSKAGQDVTGVTAAVQRRFPWTQVHSHYALMGGYVFDTNGSPASFFPDGRTRLTLTPEALLKIAEFEPNLLPDLSKGNIQDKSKADGLAKTIVCAQALWYVVPGLGWIQYPLHNLYWR